MLELLESPEADAEAVASLEAFNVAFNVLSSADAELLADELPCAALLEEPALESVDALSLSEAAELLAASLSFEAAKCASKVALSDDLAESDDEAALEEAALACSALLSEALALPEADESLAALKLASTLALCDDDAADEPEAPLAEDALACSALLSEALPLLEADASLEALKFALRLALSDDEAPDDAELSLLLPLLAEAWLLPVAAAELLAASLFVEAAFLSLVAVFVVAVPSPVDDPLLVDESWVEAPPPDEL